MRSLALSFIGFSLLLVSCNQSSGGSDSGLAAQRTIAKNIFSDSKTDFKINVFYEASAAPYVGTIGVTANQTWDITKSSYAALFQNHPARTITVPSTLGQMTSISDHSKSSWTSAELIQLASSSAVAFNIGSQVNMNVFFVRGTYQGSTSTLGVQFSGSPYAFVFKDVVVSTGGDSISQRYVEQTTVVHEVGHAVGLVNNGLPMSAPHEDLNHPHHTTNSNCAMYWAVESNSSILSSIANLIIGNQLNLFGAESLQDGRTYHP